MAVLNRHDVDKLDKGELVAIDEDVKYAVPVTLVFNAPAFTFYTMGWDHLIFILYQFLALNNFLDET